MKNRNQIEILFAQAADLMGWDRSDAYDKETRKSRVGATFIQRAATEKAYYRIVQISNEHGGESTLEEAMTSAELEYFLRGIIRGASRASR